MNPNCIHKGSKMATLTIKNIPLEVYERLKRRAKANRRSINQEAVAVIERAQEFKSRPKAAVLG